MKAGFELFKIDNQTLRAPTSGQPTSLSFGSLSDLSRRNSGGKAAIMSTNDRSYMAVVPWYDEDDFADLLAIGGEAIEPSQSYEVWYRSTMQSIDNLLRAGKAVAFVTIKPRAYIAWLDGAENTPEMRRGYAEHLATCVPPEIDLHAREQGADPNIGMSGSSEVTAGKA